VLKQYSIFVIGVFNIQELFMFVFPSLYLRHKQGPGWLNELSSWIT
jgi:hypothetical protein